VIQHVLAGQAFAPTPGPLVLLSGASESRRHQLQVQSEQCRAPLTAGKLALRRVGGRRRSTLTSSRK
jgi:hypothetical protein